MDVCRCRAHPHVKCVSLGKFTGENIVSFEFGRKKIGKEKK